jgi:hypothetical protein
MGELPETCEGLWVIGGCSYLSIPLKKAPFPKNFLPLLKSHIVFFSFIVAALINSKVYVST